MAYNSSGYLAYKKNKYRKDVAKPPKPMSKVGFLFQLFVATFIVVFVVIVFSIMNFSSKMDIEYSKKEKFNNAISSNLAGNADDSIFESEKQLKIDKRLLLIQQEENAPSEAKIVNKPNGKSDVIDPIYIENNKKLEKEQKLKELVEAENNGTAAKEEKYTPLTSDNKNITIMSKVLVGRFSSFEEAQKLQTIIKSKDESLSPYVKKVGDVFTVQLGSYQDFEVAKNQAHNLKSKGLDVWIYQQ